MVARDRHGRRGQHRTGIGDQQIDLILGDQLIIQRGRGRGVALVVIGDELDRDLLVERLHIDAALGIFLLDPELQRAVDRHRNRGEAPGRRIERADLDFGRRVGSKGWVPKARPATSATPTVLNIEFSRFLRSHANVPCGPYCTQARQPQLCAWWNTWPAVLCAGPLTSDSQLAHQDRNGRHTKFSPLGGAADMAEPQRA